MRCLSSDFRVLVVKVFGWKLPRHAGPLRGGNIQRTVCKGPWPCHVALPVALSCNGDIDISMNAHVVLLLEFFLR